MGQKGHLWAVELHIFPSCHAFLFFPTTIVNYLKKQIKIKLRENVACFDVEIGSLSLFLDPPKGSIVV